jgi:hypothetical protein
MALKYREVEYTVVQGIERSLWKWEVSFDGLLLKGHSDSKPDAMAKAERAIDRALARQKLKVVRPEQD